MKLTLTFLATAVLTLSACGGGGGGGGGSATATKYLGTQGPLNPLQVSQITSPGGLTLPNGDVVQLIGTTFYVNGATAPYNTQANPKSGQQELLIFKDSDGNEHAYQVSEVGPGDTYDTALFNTTALGLQPSLTLNNVGYNYVASQGGVSTPKTGLNGTITVTNGNEFDGYFDAAHVEANIAGTSLVGGTATLNGIVGTAQGAIGVDAAVPTLVGSAGEFWGSNGSDGFQGNWYCNTSYGGANSNC